MVLFNLFVLSIISKSDVIWLLPRAGFLSGFMGGVDCQERNEELVGG